MELSLAPFQISVKIPTLFIGSRAGSLLQEKLEMALQNLADEVCFPGWAQALHGWKSYSSPQSSQSSCPYCKGNLIGTQTIYRGFWQGFCMMHITNTYNHNHFFQHHKQCEILLALTKSPYPAPLRYEDFRLNTALGGFPSSALHHWSELY